MTFFFEAVAQRGSVRGRVLGACSVGETELDSVKRCDSQACAASRWLFPCATQKALDERGEGILDFTPWEF